MLHVTSQNYFADAVFLQVYEPSLALVTSSVLLSTKGGDCVI